ncbi:MAG: hypothetical protein GF308_16345 [Candidatus Heimdallarchaeota archaeon]|nr:hypothetical protein [Candidatus Heimdallarchaeota archaeon]
MSFDVTGSFGFARLGALKLNSKVVEFPTLMSHYSEHLPKAWSLGDRGHQIAMNYPPNFLDPQINPEFKGELVFIANFLMQRGIREDILNEQLEKTTQEISVALNVLSPKQAVALTQPSSSLEFLKAVLQKLNDFDIKKIAITNLLPFLTNQRKMVEFIGTIRTMVPIDSLLFLLSPVPHTLIPLLIYAGIDAFSDGFATIAAHQNVFLTDTSGLPLTELEENLCSCPVCQGKDNLSELLETVEITDKSKKMAIRGRPLLEQHNRWIFTKKIRETRNALKRETLRNYIEQTIQYDVFNAAALRLLDQQWQDWLVSRTPTWLETPVYSITSYSYSRPAITEFQRRVRERYQIPSQKKVVILFPCSASKPYSTSRTHRFYQNALENVPWKKRGYLQEIILTSPLGVVPRELELVYPAAHYDIPVTGTWSHEEKQIAVSQLESVLSSFVQGGGAVVAHVTGEYLELCAVTSEKLDKAFIYTSKNQRPSSLEAVAQLSKMLNNLVADLPPLSPYYPDIENIRAIADYQFGLGIGKEIFPNNCRLKGRPPYPLRILSGKEHLGVIHPSTGELTLSLSTGTILAEKKSYYVVFDGKDLQGSTLFAVGVNEADPLIRPTDAVVIIDKSQKMLAVGQAVISGKDMVPLTRGPAVNIKHKI